MITFDHVTKAYPDGTVAVDDLTLECAAGKITALVGPSGCGKTTSLRMINRLIEPTSGTISLDGEPTKDMDPAVLRRRIGYVIQHAGLFPHRTIVDNIATTARLLGQSKKQARTRAMELLETVGLATNFANRYPWQLSGGQQQRVGVARALASDPSFILMDEPFSAVDPVVRAQLQEELLRLQREIGKTIIIVTHDIDEALKLGDHVVVMRTGGILAQHATPVELLTAPADEFVAEFVGRDRGYRSLGFTTIDGATLASAEPTITVGDSAETARAIAVDDWLLVLDEHKKPIGWVQPSTIAGQVKTSDLNYSGTLADSHGTLRALLDAALSAPSRRGVVVDDDGFVLGTVTARAAIEAIDNAAVSAVAR